MALAFAGQAAGHSRILTVAFALATLGLLALAAIKPQALHGAIAATIGLAWPLEAVRSGLWSTVAVVAILATGLGSYASLVFAKRTIAAPAVARHAWGRIWSITTVAAAVAVTVWWLPRWSAPLLSTRWAASTDASSTAYLTLWVFGLLAMGTAVTMARLSFLRRANGD